MPASSSRFLLLSQDRKVPRKTSYNTTTAPQNHLTQVREQTPKQRPAGAGQLLTESLTWGQMSYSLAPSSTLMEHLSRDADGYSERRPAAPEAAPAPYLAPLDSLRMMWLVRSNTFPSQNS